VFPPPLLLLDVLLSGMTACTAPTTVPAAVAATCVTFSAMLPALWPNPWAFSFTCAIIRVAALRALLVRLTFFVVFFEAFLVVFFVAREAFFVDFFDVFFVDLRAAFFELFFFVAPPRRLLPERLDLAMRFSFKGTCLTRV